MTAPRGRILERKLGAGHSISKVLGEKRSVREAWGKEENGKEE